MSTFLRNAEIRRSIYLWLIVNAVAITLGFIRRTEVGIAVSVVCLVLDCLHFGSTYRRYKRLAELSREIDKILHNSDKFDLKRFAEGELSILHSEIYKMTSRLREQADVLAKDKVYLADSIADISHQIRTPLTSIHLIAEFLSEENLTQERRLSLTKDLFRLLARIEWLITTLLKISKLDTGTVRFQKDRVNVHQVLQKAFESIAIPMELRGQELIINDEGEETFEGDFSWTVEAVENILKNCMEHTPEGGKITAAVKETPIFTELVISDTGPGFVPEDIPRLFERFYKGKNAGDNSYGIGLALSRMIITRQNGTIKAENGKNGGAEFCIRFYKCTV